MTFEKKLLWQVLIGIGTFKLWIKKTWWQSLLPFLSGNSDFSPGLWDSGNCHHGTTKLVADPHNHYKYSQCFGNPKKIDMKKLRNMVMTNRFRPSGYPAVFTPIWVNKIRPSCQQNLLWILWKSLFSFLSWQNLQCPYKVNTLDVWKHQKSLDFPTISTGDTSMCIPWPRQGNGPWFGYGCSEGI